MVIKLTGLLKKAWLPLLVCAGWFASFPIPFFFRSLSPLMKTPAVKRSDLTEWGFSIYEPCPLDKWIFDSPLDSVSGKSHI